MTDLDIGKHCGNADCKRLDFLPIRCPFCNKHFCKNHIIGLNHDCQNIPAIEIGDGIVKVYKCSLDYCSGTEHIEIICQCCKLVFCLTHRHCKDHNCMVCITDKSPKRTYAIDSIVKDIIKGAVQPARKSIMSEKSQRLNKMVKLQKMKMKADGDKRIPVEFRRYLSVHAILRSEINIVPCFVNAQWTVGRCIDELVKILGIIQSNNNKDFFRIFFNGRIIEPLDVKLDSLINNDFYNGMPIVLARINDNTIKEIDISKYDIPAI